MICWVGVRSPDLLELPPALPEPFPALFPPQDTRARLREAARTRDNTMWNKYAAAKGSLQGGKRTDGQPLKPGTAVFLTKGSDRHHVGLYVGDGKVIEAMVR